MRISSLRKHAYSNILKILAPKKWKFSDKKSWYFSYICLKHRLWVFVRTASTRPTIVVQRVYLYLYLYFRAELRKIMHTPVNPSFTIWKWGLRGSKYYRYIFVMCLLCPCLLLLPLWIKCNIPMRFPQTFCLSLFSLSFSFSFFFNLL